MYYRCIPFSRSFDTYGLVYRVPKGFKLQAGNIVIIPFGKSKISAICYGVAEEKDIHIDISEIKEIVGLLDDFIYLSEKQLECIHFISAHYFSLIHKVLNLYFPRNLLEKIEKNTREKIQISQYSYPQGDISLSSQQLCVYKNITNNNSLRHLIYGVTGSGKTQIYMKLIQDSLHEGKQTLLLIPEIILTSQIGEKLQEVFGSDVLLLHSGVSAAKKSKYWMDIYSGNAKIIIGTRSALFYPYNNLGKIIIDEEHDSSYISDSAPRYHTLDVAKKLSDLYSIPLILGSGTPLATTLYSGLNGDFVMHQLLEKFSEK